MIFHASSSQYPRSRIKQEDYALPLYATSPTHDVGVLRRNFQLAETQNRGLEYRTASSINSTASSGAFGRVAGDMPQKRSSPGDANGTPAKHIKAEHPEEFSNAVKKKLQSSTRTGQACDRCKVSSIWGQATTWVAHELTPFPRSRYARLDVMGFQEDVPLVCRTIPNVVRPTESLVARPREVMSRDWSNKTATCSTEFANWSND
jgi:hypothetical protein